MTISKDKIGALIFFILSTCYGYYAFQIPLYPGEEYEVFTSQSMPKLYAILGMGIAALALLLSVIEDLKNSQQPSTAKQAAPVFFDKKGWIQCAALIGLMLYYALTLEFLGFILSTISFLIIGYLILGERKPKTLFFASVPVVIVFWAIMTQLLGIYLSAGDLWS